MDVQEKADDEFYQKAIDYWSEIPATIDGMLGGFGHISQTDILASRQFLKLIFQSERRPGRTSVVDCGSGIGRITKHLLSNIFEHIDLVEQNSAFLEQSKEYLGSQILNKIGSFYNVGLQDFQPQSKKYDVIWCQWVLGHLTDLDFLQFLRRCRDGLNDNGVIIIKENIATYEVETDEKDSSVTRPYYLYMELFQKANLRCERKMKQTNFPKGLYAVYMFAVRPED